MLNKPAGRGFEECRNFQIPGLGVVAVLGHLDLLDHLYYFLGWVIVYLYLYISAIVCLYLYRQIEVIVYLYLKFLLVVPPVHGQGVAAIILLKSGPQELTEPARSDIARLKIHHYHHLLYKM